eukprot:93152-Amphidinium_carterae.1
MAATITRASPLGSLVGGGEADVDAALRSYTERAKALQLFSKIRLSYAPKEYQQLFETASVATELPKGSVQQ